MQVLLVFEAFALAHPSVAQNPGASTNIPRLFDLHVLEQRVPLHSSPHLSDAVSATPTACARCRFATACPTSAETCSPPSRLSRCRLCVALRPELEAEAGPAMSRSTDLCVVSSTSRGLEVAEIARCRLAFGLFDALCFLLEGTTEYVLASNWEWPCHT